MLHSRRGWVTPLRTGASLVLATLVLQVPVATEQSGRARRSVQYEGRLVAANEVLYKFRQANPLAARVAAEQQAEAEESAPTGRAGARWLRSRRFDTARLLAMLRANPDIEYAEPNYVLTALGRQDRLAVTRVPADTFFTLLWGLRNTGQTVNGVAGTAGADISATSAWGVTTGARGNVVGVIDTGIDYTHPDLAANMWSAPSAFTVTVGGRSITCPAGSHGFNAVANTCDPADDDGHGTHVAGTIGASGDNGVGVTGVNWVASLMGLKFLDASGSGYTSDAIEAIEFAIQAKAGFGSAANVRVLSNSWGGGAYSQALADEITLANTREMLFVAAAGNSGANNDTTPTYPANYAAPNVIAVAATDQRDQLASFSNYGAAKVHLGAPGVSIASTWPGSAYAWASGTSMATPHVAGAAALALAACPFTTAQLKSALLATVDPIGALAGRTLTGGRLNVNRAVLACAPPATPTLVSPAGAGTVANPTFVWNVDPSVESYQLYVQLSGGAVVFQRWAPASTLCGASTCSWTPGLSLGDGSYAFSVQGRNAAGYSAWAAFSPFTVGVPAPARVTLTSPTGAISATAPAFTWAVSSGATRYQLYIQVNNGPVLYQRWLNAGEVCSGATCSVAAPVALAFGTTYAFSVQASNAGGLSPWADFLTFTPTAATPAAPVLTAPTGVIASTMPAFTWSPSATATRYQLYIQVQGGAVVYQRWLNAGDICAGSACTVTAPVGLAFGTTYAFSVQASNAAGLSPWAGFATFTPTASVPAAATLSAPSGSSASTSPTFVWGAVAHATRYQLYVQVAGGAVLFQRWLNADDLCSGSTCTVSSVLSLGSGDYVAYVQTGNASGNGPWSGPRTFTVTASGPGAVTLISPAGQISTLTPTFVWSAAADATRYQLYIQVRSGAVVYQRWLEASAQCSGATCSATPPITLSTGTTYDFTVQASNGAAFGPWAAPMAFSIAAGTPAAAIPLAPSGTASGQVVLEWSRASSDLSYQVYVQSEAGPVVLQRWFPADGTCAADRCSTPAAVDFTPGVRYAFYVQTRTTSGYSSWSAPITFVYQGSGATAARRH